jgi:glucokinase
MTKDS